MNQMKPDLQNKRYLTTEEMLKAPLPEGCMFVNIAPVGSEPVWEMRPMKRRSHKHLH